MTDEYLHTVEGNCSNMVRECYYYAGDTWPYVIVNVPYPAEDGPDGIFSYLSYATDLNEAAICGLLGNIEAESGVDMDPNVVDWVTADGYGLFMWTDWGVNTGNKTRLIEWCNANGYDFTTTQGQLEFFIYDMENNYQTYYNYLLSVPNTAQGAYDAAYYFCVNYERPINMYANAARRGSLAKDKYWPIYGLGVTSSDD